MSLDVQKLTALLTSISAFNVTLRARLETKLEANATAADSAKLNGKTLTEILTDLDAASQTQLQALSADLTAFMARQDNPHNVTKAQVGLGDVQNYGVATDADAVTGTATDKYLTPANMAAFWADKVGTAPETLDTIQEIATALQNNPDVIAALQTLVQSNADDIAAMQLLLDSKLGMTGLDLVAEGADKARFVSGTPAEIGNVTLVTGIADALALGIPADLGAVEGLTGVVTITSGSVGGVVSVSRKFVAQIDGASASFEQVGTPGAGWATWSRTVTGVELAALRADTDAGFQSLIDEMEALAAQYE